MLYITLDSIYKRRRSLWTTLSSLLRIITWLVDEKFTLLRTLFDGKIDHIPLVLSLKWVWVWIARHFLSPKHCFRAGYHVNDDVHYLTFPELRGAEGSWRFFCKLPLCCARCFLLASITKWRFRESWRSSRETSYQKECVYGSEERLYERWRIGRSWFSTRILHRAIITMYFAKWEFEPEVQRTNWPWRKRKVFASPRCLVVVEVRASTCVSCSCIHDVKNYELQQVQYVTF